MLSTTKIPYLFLSTIEILKPSFEVFPTISKQNIGPGGLDYSVRALVMVLGCSWCPSQCLLH